AAWLLAVASLCLGHASAVVLVQDGEPKATIVLPEVDSPVAKRASVMLQSHLKQITGATVPIRTERDLTAEAAQKQSLILLGEGRLAKQLGFSAEGLSAGGYHAEARGNIVALAGTDMRTPGDYWGTLYATTRFLELLGVRYLWPGELGKVVP